MKTMKYLLLFLFSIILFSCSRGPYAVKYTATGSSGTLYVSYIDADGITQNYTGTSPWSHSFIAKSNPPLKVTAHCDLMGTSEVHIIINNIDKEQDKEIAINASASTRAE